MSWTPLDGVIIVHTVAAVKKNTVLTGSHLLDSCSMMSLDQDPQSDVVMLVLGILGDCTPLKRYEVFCKQGDLNSSRIVTIFCFAEAPEERNSRIKFWK
jgi:hypothetical protein